MSDLLLVLIVVATALNGIAAGASLDQSIKQLPARHRIGAVAYATYSQAGDLGNGLFWYAGLGMCAVLVSLAATIVAIMARSTIRHNRRPIVRMLASLLRLASAPPGRCPAPLYLFPPRVKACEGVARPPGDARVTGRPPARRIDSRSVG